MLTHCAHVLWIGQGLEELCTAGMAAVRRCVQGCGGVEMESLLRSLEDGFVTYFEAGASSIEQCTHEDPAVAYGLLTLANDCKTQFDKVNAAARVELLALRTQLHPSSTDTSTAILRRVGKLYCALDGRRSARLAATLGVLLLQPLSSNLPVQQSSVAFARVFAIEERVPLSFCARCAGEYADARRQAGW